jgi:hypothetical protein
MHHCLIFGWLDWFQKFLLFLNFRYFLKSRLNHPDLADPVHLMFRLNLKFHSNHYYRLFLNFRSDLELLVDPVDPVAQSAPVVRYFLVDL